MMTNHRDLLVLAMQTGMIVDQGATMMTKRRFTGHFRAKIRPGCRLIVELASGVNKVLTRHTKSLIHPAQTEIRDFNALDDAFWLTCFA